MTSHRIDQDNPQLPYVDVVHAARPADVDAVNPAAAALEGDAELQFRPEFRRYTRLSGPTGMKPFVYQVRDCLGDFARADGHSWPTIQQICDLTELSYSTVKRALKTLAALKQIEVQDVHPDYDMRRNVYRFTAVDHGLVPAPRVPLKDGVIGKLLEDNRALQTSNQALLSLLEEHGIPVPEEFMVQAEDPTVVVVTSSNQYPVGNTEEEVTTTTPDMILSDPYLADPYSADPEIESMKAWARENWTMLKARGIESLGGITHYWAEHMDRYAEYRDDLDLEAAVLEASRPSPQAPAVEYSAPELPELDADPEAHAVWEQVKEGFRATLPAPTFEAYLERTEGVDLSGSRFRVACISAFHATWLERRMYNDLNESFNAVLGKTDWVELSFVVGKVKEVSHRQHQGGQQE